MNGIGKHALVFGAFAAVLVLAISVSVSLTAQILAQGGNTNVINACVRDGVGVMLLVEEGAGCEMGWSPRTWNVQGPSGLKGDTGPTGPQGPQGPKGDPGTATSTNWQKNGSTISYAEGPVGVGGASVPGPNVSMLVESADNSVIPLEIYNSQSVGDANAYFGLTTKKSGRANVSQNGLTIGYKDNGGAVIGNHEGTDIKLSINGHPMVILEPDNQVRIGYDISPYVTDLILSGFLKLALTTGQPTDPCTDSRHWGNTKFDADAGLLYICSKNSGWVAK